MKQLHKRKSGDKIISKRERDRIKKTGVNLFEKINSLLRLPIFSSNALIRLLWGWFFFFMSFEIRFWRFTNFVFIVFTRPSKSTARLQSSSVEHYINTADHMGTIRPRVKRCCSLGMSCTAVKFIFSGPKKREIVLWWREQKMKTKLII